MHATFSFTRHTHDGITSRASDQPSSVCAARQRAGAVALLVRAGYQVIGERRQLVEYPSGASAWLVEASLRRIRDGQKIEVRSCEPTGEVEPPERCILADHDDLRSEMPYRESIAG